VYLRIDMRMFEFKGLHHFQSVTICIEYLIAVRSTL
jgi:hypothetical protein